MVKQFEERLEKLRHLNSELLAAKDWKNAVFECFAIPLLLGSFS
jgi:hypothetical protein